MKIKEIKENKKQYLEILLLADEQESMIDKYIERGTMYILFDDTDVKSVCIVTDEKNKVLEIKNIATKPPYQGLGYGKKLIDFIIDKYSSSYDILQVGTSEDNIKFYEKCGFKKSHIVKNFFIDNYDHEIFENGKQLVDMIYLQRLLRKETND